MKDSQGHTLAACFGYPGADPDVCKHPLAARYTGVIDEPILMYGKAVATPDQQPNADSPWAAPGKRGKPGEFWYTLAQSHQTRCFACGTVIHDGVWCFHLQELPAASLAALPRISLEDAQAISWHKERS